LIERWAAVLGWAEAEAFARANNNPAPVAFRFTSKTPEKRGLLEELRAAGASLDPSKLVPDAWRIKGAGELLQRLAREGLVYVQDEASQLVAQVLGCEPGDRVLDVCAAPGSKTTHVAAKTPQALIVAGDLHVRRLQTLRQLAANQGSNIHCIVAHDGVKGLPFAPGSFDRVLVDAPCTGTGTLRHNPEIRWRITNADIIELAARQKVILSNAAKLVRRGGKLIYSTCSVELEENEGVVQDFLKGNVEFESVEPDWSKPVSRALAGSALVMATGAVRTWPQTHDVDGFFIAAFTRV
jgi:16S rRNA (cytosine967-C5)-methyltransferase